MMFFAYGIVLSVTAIIQVEGQLYRFTTYIFPGVDRGRVDVRYFSRWGTVHQRDVERYNAKVVCKSKGQPSEHAVSVFARTFGISLGPVWIWNVQCAGNESEFGDCRHAGWGDNDYEHKWDMGVICFKNASILLNKPALFSDSLFQVINVNDGNWVWTKSRTQISQNPYWQGDLQGFYMVDSIIVASNVGEYLRNATIGVSAHDVTCKDGEIVECGRWPNDVLDTFFFITFNCTLTAPVRFVIIQRKGDNLILELMEVHVEGTPSSISVSGDYYDWHESRKVTTPTMVLTATSLNDCASKCNTQQPCTGFSYSQTQQQNCLLAASDVLEIDPEWKSGCRKLCL